MDQKIQLLKFTAAKIERAKITNAALCYKMQHVWMLRGGKQGVTYEIN